MDILNFNYSQLESFLFVFSRVMAIIVFAPILGSPQVPSRFKVGLALVFSILIFPMVKFQPLAEPRGLFDLAIHLATDAAIGLSLAFAVRLIFTAVQVAGTVVDFQMGFGVVNVIDPQTQAQVSVTAQFQNILAILIFLATDAHHFIIGAVVQSFDLINPSQVDFSNVTPEFILRTFSSMFLVAVKIAAPIMAILFFLSVGLGLVARTVPQMNVFIVGFPLQIGVGLVMVALAMPFFSVVLQNQIAQLPARLAGLMQTF
ncbi:MAG: flagellar biosynthetic protein FliR [Nitrospinaceae bacterium]|nr:MAG: flagellar biosynthetic protein FliR [Nitrospinaceae bacterium]